MKEVIFQQEILLVANTAIFKKQLCKPDATKNNYYLSFLEQLEEACWNGLLNELIPEIIEKSPSGKKLSLCQIRPGKSFLEIELSESQVLIETQFSIYPNFFISTILFN